ncbi:MAG: TolC family protein [Desulfobacteraceae bacterium]|nr:TolC family protein [Desulfobacteraceae bacterium]
MPFSKKGISLLRLSLWCFVFAMISSWTTASFADEKTDGKEVLTLSRAIDIAIANNPLLKSAEALVEASRADTSASFSAFLPNLNLNENFERTNNPPMVFTHKLAQQRFTSADFAIDRLNNPSPINNWQTQFVLTQPVFNQGREIIGYRLSKVREQISDAERVKLRQTICFQTEKAYYQTILAKDNLGVLNASVETSKAMEELSAKRAKAGLALKSDVLAAQVQLTSTERERLRAEGDIKIAMATLNKIMGMPQDHEWKIAPDPRQATDAMSMDLDSWLETARKNRPEIIASRRLVEAAKLKTKGARFRFLPSVNLQGAYESDSKDLAGSNGDSWSLMAIMSFNIFNGFGDRARLAAADAEERRAVYQDTDVGAEVALEVRRAYFNLITAQKQLDVVSKAAAQAEETLRILKKRYENGLALMVEVLSAETALRKARLQEAESRFDLRVAMSDLKLKAGVLER